VPTTFSANAHRIQPDHVPSMRFPLLRTFLIEKELLSLALRGSICSSFLCGRCAKPARSPRISFSIDRHLNRPADHQQFRTLVFFVLILKHLSSVRVNVPSGNQPPILSTAHALVRFTYLDNQTLRPETLCTFPSCEGANGLERPSVQ
jgi:hypothetical protein